LEREILGFGGSIKVLLPRKLKGTISYSAKKKFIIICRKLNIKDQIGFSVSL